MPLNKQSGNMYSFVTHTWNTVKGKCPHGCHYCYMKRWGSQKPIRLDQSELKTDLGTGNFIFVGSSCDLFADAIPPEWIEKTLSHCLCFSGNRILLQSKNPGGIIGWEPLMDNRFIIGTTIETNRVYPEMGIAPPPISRMIAMESLSRCFKTMVTVEPIMDFDVGILSGVIKNCHPEWVNIGANTDNKTNLTEPSAEKIRELISSLEDIGINVKLKANLSRLYNQRD